MGGQSLIGDINEGAELTGGGFRPIPPPPPHLLSPFLLLVLPVRPPRPGAPFGREQLEGGGAGGGLRAAPPPRSFPEELRVGLGGGGEQNDGRPPKFSTPFPPPHPGFPPPAAFPHTPQNPPPNLPPQFIFTPILIPIFPPPQ